MTHVVTSVRGKRPFAAFSLAFETATFPASTGSVFLSFSPYRMVRETNGFRYRLSVRSFSTVENASRASVLDVLVALARNIRFYKLSLVNTLFGISFYDRPSDYFIRLASAFEIPFYLRVTLFLAFFFYAF